LILLERHFPQEAIAKEGKGIRLCLGIGRTRVGLIDICATAFASLHFTPDSFAPIGFQLRDFFASQVNDLDGAIGPAGVNKWQANRDHLEWYSGVLRNEPQPDELFGSQPRVARVPEVRRDVDGSLGDGDKVPFVHIFSGDAGGQRHSEAFLVIAFGHRESTKPCVGIRLNQMLACGCDK
jgi:hypothetical protein